MAIHADWPVCPQEHGWGRAWKPWPVSAGMGSPIGHKSFYNIGLREDWAFIVCAVCYLGHGKYHGHDSFHGHDRFHGLRIETTYAAF